MSKLDISSLMVLAQVVIAPAMVPLPAQAQTNFPQVMPADTVYGKQFQSGPGEAISFSVLAQRMLGQQIFVTGTPQAGWVPIATGPTSAAWGPLGGTTVLSAQNFPGADMGAQIANCLAALPSSGGVFGGVCDARSLPNSGTIAGFTITSSNATLLMPCGLFAISSTINIGNGTNTLGGFRMVGCGATPAIIGGTELVWVGASTTTPMLRLRGVRDSEISNIHLHSSTDHPLAEALRSETATGTTSTANKFRNITIDGQNGGMGIGIRWCVGSSCGGAGPDANNDGNYLENVSVQNYSGSAFSIEGAQSKTHIFMNSQFNSGGFGQNGVFTSQGSFRWYGGLGGLNSVADFNLGAPTDNILIEGCNTETSNRFLQTTSSGSIWAVTIIQCRYGADAINADNRAIVYQNTGPLTMIGNIFEGGLSGKNPQVWLNPGGSTSIGTAIGNSFTWDISLPVVSTSDPFTSATGNYWNTMGNKIQNGNASTQFNVIDKTALSLFTVANLPACNAAYEGNRKYVTDQNTGVAYRGAVTGGGTTRQNVLCSNSAWIQD